MQEDTQQRQRPFLFATVKGATGHQESGAGVAGLMAAAAVVGSAQVPAALHLRDLNPYVHGALAGHPVSIARGGPYGVPAAQPHAALLLGVSSFGAQGTNAHALLAGSGAAAAVGGHPGGAAPAAWRRARIYAAPAVQQLLSACLLRKRSRAASVAFEAQLSSPRLAYLWDYSLQGRPHLPSAALLSMAASLLPLLGAVAEGDDANTASLAAVADAALVAPAPLPARAAAALVAPAVASVKLTRATGSVEVSMAEQKLLAARLAPAPAATSDSWVAAGSGASPVLRGLAARQAGADGGVVAEVAALAAADVSGYALHPLLLDACLSQAAAAAQSATSAASPLTWVRSVGAALVPAVSPAGCCVAAAYAPIGGWHAGGALLAAAGGSSPCAAAALLGVVLGDQDMPPASPAPLRLSAAETAAVAAAAAAEEEAAEEAGAIRADHPLLQMAEEERLLHLHAQVGGLLWRRSERAAATLGGRKAVACTLCVPRLLAHPSLLNTPWLPLPPTLPCTR